MGCQICTDSLTALLDSQLHDPERVRVEDHLKECSRCREEYESLRYSYHLIDEAAEIQSHTQLWERVRANIDSRRGRTRFRLPGFRPLPLASWIPHIVTGVAVVLLASAGLLLSSYPRRIGAEWRFRSYVREREQVERRHMGALIDYQGVALNQLHSNPFADHDHGAPENPFASE